MPSRGSVIAMCVIDANGAAPCQCFWPAGILTTSPGTDLLDAITPPLNPAGAGRDDEDLTCRMRMPRRASTRLERHGTGTRL